MKCLLLIILAGYAVRCDDDNSYYVIEMPDNDPQIQEIKKPFQVYWNVPTMQCKSKRIPFENLYEKYGILQNKNDSFRGEEISILYDPGLFPALLKNETSGKFKFRNGGVPQEGNLDKHLDSFKNVLEQSIPNVDFSGIGIIDFESWRPVFRQNFGVLVPYKDVSYEIEKNVHWWWRKSWIQNEAKRRFEESARAFMQTSLSIAKQMRPKALWGYYGFPYCFNMANKNMAETCADKVPAENDQTYWLWSESTALYPSVYSTQDLTSSQLVALIRGRVREAFRVRRKDAPILPYFWFRYRDGGYLNKEDLETALETLYKSNASGFIIWGSSNDVNTVNKCNHLLNYMETVMGPAITKYTKPPNKINDEVPNDINKVTSMDINNHLTTTLRSLITDNNNNDSIDLDPEYHWIPPENYTQDIKKHVEEEIKKKTVFNQTVTESLNKTVLYSLNNSVLIDLILKSILDNSDESQMEIQITEEKGLPEKVNIISSTTSYSNTEKEFDLEISQSQRNTLVTNNPILDKNAGNPQQNLLHSNLFTSNEQFDATTTTDNFPDLESTTDNDYGYTENYQQFYNHDTFFEDPMTSLHYDYTTEYTDDSTYSTNNMISTVENKYRPTNITDLSESTTQITDSTTNRVTESMDSEDRDIFLVTESADDYNDTNLENATSLIDSTTTAVDQVVVYVL